jgi:hypothetical protein
MKVFFVLALLCASVCSFSQTVSRCGYAFQTFAITAGVAAAQSYIATHEGAVMAINPQVYQNTNGSWCYSFYVVTLPPPEPLEVMTTPTQVEGVAKVIQSKAQVGCAMIPYKIE